MDLKEFERKCVSVALGAAIALFILSLLAAEAEPTKWDRWSIAPYASSQEEACKKAPAAIDGFDLPPAVKDGFKRQVVLDCKGGVEDWLTPGMSLQQMWSGGKKPHIMNNKTVGELPVSKSPDGRMYRKNAVAESAKVLKWTFVHEGKSYRLYLPFVCFNWSWAYGLPPVQVAATPPAPQCRTVTVTVQPGDWIWYGVFSRRYLPASACWKVMDGDNESAPPTPCLTCDWKGVRDDIPAQYQPYHTAYYATRSARQTFSFPAEISGEYLQICLARGGVQANGVRINPHAWDTSTHITVPTGSFPTFDPALIGRDGK